MASALGLNNTLIGSAGEYFVAGELSRHGIVAALTMAGTDAFDILAVSKKGKHFAIQVKTTQYDKASWLLGKKDEQVNGENSFYVFVRLKGEQLPDYYIVSADIVSETISLEHQEWLKAPERNGRPHKDNNMREFRIALHDPRYYNRWDYFLENALDM